MHSLWGLQFQHVDFGAHTHTHTLEYYSAIIKNEIMPFAATWMDLDIVILCEVRERQVSHNITHIKSQICYKWSYLQNRNRFTDTETNLWFSSVQSLSLVQLFLTPWTAALQASLSISNSRSLLKFVSIKSVIPSNHFILCHPLLLLPSILPIIRVFSSESILLNRWPKYWSFNFNISPFNEYSGLISCRLDLLDLLAVQDTLKSLLQHHSLKASIQVVGERETGLADASSLCIK